MPRFLYGPPFSGVLWDVQSVAVAAYIEEGARPAWQLKHEGEVALGGRNLLHPSHQDGAQGGSPAELVRRNAAVSASWRY